jgi:probable HAF family extracellular repeat protein
LISPLSHAASSTPACNKPLVSMLNSRGALYLAVLMTLPAMGSGWAEAADTAEGLGFLSGNNAGSYAYAISADGRVVTGYGDTASGYSTFRWTAAGGIVDLGSINNGESSYATAINSDGSVIVGQSGTQAFRWTQAGGMVGLGFLSSATNSEAIAVNADGSVVAGRVRNSNYTNVQAFRWTQAGGMVGLGFLTGGNYSQANGISGDGSILVGSSNYASTNNFEAFRWTQSGGMVGLGFLSGGNNSGAIAISSDGNVIVGSSNDASGNTQAMRWTQASGMVGLGYLTGGNYSEAYATSANGSVIVGFSNSGSSSGEAFRWTSSGGMASVADWLTAAGVSIAGFNQFSSASGVSADGNTVVGYGTNSSNRTEAFIARVGATASSSGVVGLTDLQTSMGQTLAVSNQMEGLTTLTMNGAHHRPLTEMAVGNSQSCGWVSGDAGRYYRQANGYTGLAEVGACHDFEEHGVRVGLGVGSSVSDLKLENKGRSRVDGEYGLAEVDWQLPNLPLLASLLGTYGVWNADLKRGYAMSGTAPSTGSTDITGYSLRARLDWQNAFHLGQVGFSPRLAYTIYRTEVDAYQEKGGSAPASFSDQNHTGRELRGGLTSKYAYSDKTTLLAHAEVAHRFDQRAADVVGNINALGFGIGVDIRGNKITQNWVRVGAELDYRVNDSNMLNLSTFVASAGQDPDISAALSWRKAF